MFGLSSRRLPSRRLSPQRPQPAAARPPAARPRRNVGPGPSVGAPGSSAGTRSSATPLAALRQVLQGDHAHAVCLVDTGTGIALRLERGDERIRGRKGRHTGHPAADGLGAQRISIAA